MLQQWRNKGMLWNFEHGITFLGKGVDKKLSTLKLDFMTSFFFQFPYMLVPRTLHFSSRNPFYWPYFNLWAWLEIVLFSVFIFSSISISFCCIIWNRKLTESSNVSRSSSFRISFALFRGSSSWLNKEAIFFSDQCCIIWLVFFLQETISDLWHQSNWQLELLYLQKKLSWKYSKF